MTDSAPAGAGLEQTGKTMAAISRSIDDANSKRLALMKPGQLRAELMGWIRTAKVSEEHGEVIDAWIGATGANPRKGVYGCVADVVNELLDVAATALMAVEHFQGNDGASTMPMLAEHIAGLAERIGLPS